MDPDQFARNTYPHPIAYRETTIARSQAPASQGGFSVRSNLRAGQWQCRSCQGQVNGDRMISPTCSYCQFV